MSVLRRAYVEVLPDTAGFDPALTEQLRRKDPGGKAGKQIGGQLNRALSRLDLPAIDVKADPKVALAAIDAVEHKLHSLGRDAETVEVKVRTEQALGQLQRFKKQIGDVGDEDVDKAGKKIGTRLSEGISETLTLVKSPAVLASAAVAAAPLIGAAISAGVIGGAGVGGVVGGLLLVKDDPRVQAAGAALGQKLLGDLKSDAQLFVQPVLTSIDKIEGRFQAMNGKIRSIFAQSSTFLDPLVRGALDGVQGLLSGIEDLVTKGKPVIDAFGRSFATLGQSTGKALSVISGGSGEAAKAVDHLSENIGHLVVGTGYLIRGLTEAYGVLTFLPDKIGSGLERTVTGIDMAAAKVRVAGTAVDTFSTAIRIATKAIGGLAATEDEVSAAQKAATTAQQDYTRTLDTMGGSLARSTQLADGLRKATQALFGAQQAATDANEAYEASWDSLSASIKTNGRSLDIHTVAGRSNRDALEGVATASRDMYLADIAAGIGIDTATKKHNNRIAALEREASKSGLSKKATKELIDTYGAIPKKKETDLVLGGLTSVAKALQGLYLYQRSLATGRTVSQVARDVAKEKGLAPGFQGPVKGPDGNFYADGGWTGPGSKYQQAGVVHADEYVVNKKARGSLEDANPGGLDYMNRTGRWPAYASGGRVAPVDTSHRWPFLGSLSGTRIPSRAEVASKVILAVPSGGRTSDWIVRAAHQIVPGLQVLSQDRPGARTLTGNVSYHALGRAVDFHWNRKLAEVWNARYMSRTKELITPWQDLNIENGRRHAYSPLVYNQHNFAGGNPHDHIAMDDGGFRVLQPGLNVIRNGTGRPEPIGGPSAMASVGNTYNINVNVPVGAHPAETGRQIILAIQASERTNGSRWRQGP